MSLCVYFRYSLTPICFDVLNVLGYVFIVIQDMIFINEIYLKLTYEINFLCLTELQKFFMGRYKTDILLVFYLKNVSHFHFLIFYKVRLPSDFPGLHPYENSLFCLNSPFESILYYFLLYITIYPVK